jgi:nucleoside-diphosphate-sugar epimerase
MTSKILVTGASGFLGRNLLEYLYENTDFKICAMSRSSIEESYPSNRFSSLLQDLSCPIEDSMVEILSDVEYIIHLAGSSDVKLSLEYPVDAFNNNVVATINMLEFANRHIPNLRKFIFFSTAEVFGPSKEGERFKEIASKSPKNPYAFTKYAAEQMCRMYSKVYQIPLIVTYAMNVYGKNQSKHKFIPKMIRKISNDEVVTLHANPMPDKRNYLHVDDVSSALNFVIINAPVGEDYNIVSDVETNNLEIAIAISNFLGVKLKFELKSSATHHTKSILCNHKLKTLGWSPKVPLHSGLGRYINDK